MKRGGEREGRVVEWAGEAQKKQKITFSPKQSKKKKIFFWSKKWDLQLRKKRSS